MVALQPAPCSRVSYSAWLVVGISQVMNPLSRRRLRADRRVFSHLGQEERKRCRGMRRYPEMRIQGLRGMSLSLYEGSQITMGAVTNLALRARRPILANFTARASSTSAKNWSTKSMTSISTSVKSRIRRGSKKKLSHSL